MSGGAFKNSSNLLARNREIEELEKRVDQTKTKLKELRARKDDIATAIALGEEDIAATKTLLQEKYIEQNTAQISVDRADQQKKESANVYEDLRTENAEIEKQLEEINQGKKDIAAQLEASKQREKQLEKENSSYSEILEKQGVLEQEASHKAAAISLELANITKTAEFAIENINRINSEIEKFDEQKKALWKVQLLQRMILKRSRLILMQSHRPFWHQRTTILSLTRSLGRALQKGKDV